MKILYVCREFPYPPDSGVKLRNGHVLKQLTDNHDVHLICYGKPEDVNNPAVVSSCRSVYIVDEPQKISGLLLYFKIFLGLFSPSPYMVHSRFNSQFQTKVYSLLREEVFDVLICDSLYMAQNLPDCPIRKILNEHNIESVIINRFAALQTNPAKKIYARYEGQRMASYEDSVWRLFDQIWMCSDVDRQEVLRRIPDAAVEVIPNGVEVGEEAEGGELKPLSLVYTGIISWKPNEDAVLYFVQEIYPLIKKQVPDVQFWVVGKGPKDCVKKLAEEDASVHVTGFVDDVKDYVRQSQVVIVPLRIGSGTRLKILEAMAMKKAVVSTSVGCEGIPVKDGGNIMVADEPQQFADKVCLLLRDEQARGELERNGRQLVESQFSWDIIGQKIKELVPPAIE